MQYYGYYKSRPLTPRPQKGQIIEPNILGEIIASWPGNYGGWLTYLIENNDKVLVAVTNPKFDPASHPVIPLTCLINISPEDLEDRIEIRYINERCVKGIIVYFE